MGAIGVETLTKVFSIVMVGLCLLSVYIRLYHFSDHNIFMTLDFLFPNQKDFQAFCCYQLNSNSESQSITFDFLNIIPGNPFTVYCLVIKKYWVFLNRRYLFPILVFEVNSMQYIVGIAAMGVAGCYFFVAVANKITKKKKESKHQKFDDENK